MYRVHDIGPDSNAGVYRVGLWPRASRYGTDIPIGIGLNTLVAQAEADFGAERFGKFWRSSASVPVAFENAFGERIDDFASQLLRANEGSRSAGPRLELITVILSLATIVALAVATSLITNRR